MQPKIRVLFICTANAARSQMAEGFLNARYGDRYEASSAGIRHSTISPHAVAVMKEIGIDLSHQYSKVIGDFPGTMFDVAVTLCSHAKETCPVIHCARQIFHHDFPDPYHPADNDAQALDGFRAVRDEISLWIDECFGRPSLSGKLEMLQDR